MQPWATSSLPVPDSPVISTVVCVGPTFRITFLDRLDRRAFAHELVELGLSMQLASKCLIFLKQAAKANEPIDLGEQVFEENWLYEVVLRAVLKCGDGIFDGGIRSDHDEERVWTDLKHAVQDRIPVGAGKLDIAQRDVRLK